MRIVIVRLTSLGDVVHTLPVAAAIRTALPTARIAWIVEEHEQVLVRDNPVVDDVVVAPLRRWRRLLARGGVRALAHEMREFTSAIRMLAADVTLDVQGWAHKTSPIVALTKAPRKIGFDRSHARDPWSPMFTTDHIAPDPAAVHVVDQNLALLRPLGITSRRAAFVLPRWPGAAERADAWMRNHELRTAPIVLLPSTRGRRKLWAAAAYRGLADRLARTTANRVVLAGGPGDVDVFDAVRSHRDDLDVYAPEPVGDLAAFLARASLVIGNDTGPLHLAAAADVPTIGLFGPTSGARNGPYGPNGSFIQSPTGRMADISVDTVFERAIQVLTKTVRNGDGSARSAGASMPGRTP